MGPTVNGLDKLLRMPTGCGEQTMIGFAPDVFITNYLKATNQLSSDIEEKALNFMEKGWSILTVFVFEPVMPWHYIIAFYVIYFHRHVHAEKSVNGSTCICLLKVI